MKKIKATLVAATVCLLATATVRGNLVVNGGFETGDFTGWMLSGNTGNTGVGRAGTLPAGGLPHSGNYAAYFGAVNSPTILVQTLVPTVPGSTYDLSFWLQNNGGPLNLFSVSWDNNVLYSVTDASAFAWTEFDFNNLTATSTSTLLQFTLQQNPSYWHLDDVGVDPTAVVPEASTWMGALCAVLPLLLSFGRRFRKEH